MSSYTSFLRWFSSATSPSLVKHGMLLQEFPAEQHLIDGLVIHPLRRKAGILRHGSVPPFFVFPHRLAVRRCSHLSKVVCHETAGFFGFLPPRQRCRLWKPLSRELCPLWNPLPTGRSRPYWKPRAKGIIHPFGIPARFEMSTHKEKLVCGHSF